MTEYEKSTLEKPVDEMTEMERFWRLVDRIYSLEQKQKQFEFLEKADYDLRFDVNEFVKQVSIKMDKCDVVDKTNFDNLVMLIQSLDDRCEQQEGRIEWLTTNLMTLMQHFRDKEQPNPSILDEIDRKRKDKE